ncbi:endonuclease/exonuclease/phosphatase family protein [Nitratireductor sp. B36]|uniref:endonuclease/exonuclease/phosphatase family protein n=1 Tax=Nitratireductor sp. B36 TaxID=2762059 RepID=UPI001E5AC51D|nr:endonuclease/exonuclease/phosphatase family protein [Nitratireductor sp. B36]MCC5778137.1 endonuclease/exonuclease/phosphatase family protein [Nitratireductor sp. B36]
MLPAFLAIGVVLVSFPLVAGFWGRLHPALDSMAHFRLHLAVLIALMAAPLLFVKGWRQIGAAGAVLGIATLSATLLPVQATAGSARAGEADAPAARYRLLQLNLRYDNATPKQVFSLIGRTKPDIVTLNEVSGMWVKELKFLEATYPYRVVCPPPARIGGVAILSRRPFADPQAFACYDRGSMAVATVRLGADAVEIGALHLGWPWPFEQHHQVSRVAPVLERFPQTAILAGDLNATPWSVTAHRVAAAGEMDLMPGIGPTWMKPVVPEALRRLVGLPIDNVFTKGRIVPLTVERLEDVGSDHLPVLLEFGIQPTSQPDEVIEVKLARNGR